MASMRYLAYRAAFEALWLSHLPRLIRRYSACKGVIFTLHRVLPEAPADFAPNAILQVTPAFLEAAIVRVRALGMEVVSLDEAIVRIEEPRTRSPFAVFTFDDAYRDNLDHALPILRKHQCPFTLYVPSAFADGEGELWWQALEDIIAGHDALALPGNGETEYVECATLEQKKAAYDALYWRMRDMPEEVRVEFMSDLARRYGYDMKGQCRDLIMDWKELEVFASDALCTIGAHTVHHYELSKLTHAQAANEMEQSRAILKTQLRKDPVHLSYPIGAPRSAGRREFDLAREIGFRTAVTTRPGGLYAEHAAHLTALPRISLNGHFQERRYLDVFATGALFTALGRRGKVDLT